MSQASPTPLFDQEMTAQLRAALEDQRDAAARGDAGAAESAAARVADLRELLARHEGGSGSAVVAA